jgi:hypothetical protein
LAFFFSILCAVLKPGNAAFPVPALIAQSSQLNATESSFYHLQHPSLTRLAAFHSLLAFTVSNPLGKNGI